MEQRDEEYTREFNLLKKQKGFQKIIYFSSSSVCDENDNRKYIKHKRNIENFIVNNFEKYLIFRFPQILGFGGNKNNLVNYICNKLKNDELITIKKVRRSIVDIEDVVDIVNKSISEKNKILNFFGYEQIYVKELVFSIAQILKIKNPKIIEVETQPTNEYISYIEGYTNKVLKKYLK